MDVLRAGQMPEMTVRMVVTADNHLNRYAARMPAARLDERRTRLRQAFRQVVDGAIAEQVHLVVLAGDTFDALDPRNLERAAFANFLAQLRDAGIAVVAAGGNHDSPRQTTDHGGYAPFDEFAEAGLLHYFGKPGGPGVLEHVVFNLGGQRILIAGASWSVVGTDGGDPLADAIIPSLADGAPDWTVVVTHASIEGHSFPGSFEPVIRRDTIASLGADIFIAGHVHRSFTTTIPTTRGRPCQVLVPGATEWMTFGEMTGTPGFWVLELRADGTRSLERRSITPQARVTLEVTGVELQPISLGGLRPDAEAPTEVLQNRIASRQNPDAIATMRIHGPVAREVYEALNLSAVQEAGAKGFFTFDLDASGLMPEGIAVAGVSLVRRSQAEEIGATVEAMLDRATEGEREILERAYDLIAPHFVSGSEQAFAVDDGEASRSSRSVGGEVHA